MVWVRAHALSFLQVRNINLLTWGVDLVEEHLLTVVGLPSRPQRAPVPKAAISEMAFNAPRSGRMKDLSFIDEWTVRLHLGLLAP